MNSLCTKQPLIIISSQLQWNPSIAATLGNKTFILAVIIIGVAFIERLFCTQTVHLEPGCLAVIHLEVAIIQGWPLRKVPL